MQQIRHENEMLLSYTLTDQGVILLRCQTSDTVIHLPAQLEGVPVVALGDYLCAERAPDLSGQQVRQMHLTRGLEKTMPVHRARTIERVCVPATVQRLGNYTFYNCTALKRVEVSAHVREIGHGVLMNCLAFSEVFLSGDGQQRTCLPDFLGQTSGEIVVKLTVAGETGYLIFPPYYEDLQDLAPAHVFQQRIEGAGYTYRQCFDNGVLSFLQYDNALERLLRIQDYETACRIALCRLRWPVQLSQTARLAYLDCLRTHSEQAVQSALCARDTAAVAALLSLGVLHGAALHTACDLARQGGHTEALGLLLAALGSQTRPADSKSYDL